MRRIQDWLAQFKNQLQPDLFDWADDSVVPTPDNQHHSAMPVPTPKAPPNSTVHHPKNTVTQSVRTVVLGERIVPYRLERSRRKTVGMMVDVQGLRVRASPYVSVSEIERILRSKSNWILRHLSSSSYADTPSRRNFMPDLSVADGETLMLLGRTVQIRWGAAQQLPDVALSEQTIWVKRPRTRTDAREADIRACYENALANTLGDYLLVYLHQRAQWYAQHHGLLCRDIVLSNAKTLWGTCRRDGLIRMNWRLVFLDEVLVDYVLAHELSHTVQMNHSAAFWAQVARMCPDYKNLRRQLKQFDLRGA